MPSRKPPYPNNCGKQDVVAESLRHGFAQDVIVGRGFADCRPGRNSGLSSRFQPHGVDDAVGVLDAWLDAHDSRRSAAAPTNFS
jgi:hypothetical protein